MTILITAAKETNINAEDHNEKFNAFFFAFLLIRDPTFKNYHCSLTPVRGRYSIGSLRLENENEDEYEFACLVIVSMPSCQSHVTQTRKRTRTRLTEVSFVLLNNEKSLWRPLSKVCHPSSALLRS